MSTANLLADGAQFDYIVVGAGSAGAVMAAKLSEDGAHAVLLVEEGPPDDSPYIRIPKGFGKLLADPGHAAFHPTAYDNGSGRPEVWIRGKMLGGSSGVNGMVWNRGIPADYDALGAQAPGWSWDQVLPYLRGIEDHAFGASALHGQGGPIPVRVHPRHGPLHEALIAAGQALGLPRRDDMTGLEQEGIGYLQSNIDRRGQRVSAARGFLPPAVRQRANLTLATGTRVDRIRFDGRRAIGVECSAGAQKRFYRARAEVVLCAGGLASPKLLQLSGIGPAEVLQAAGVPVLHALPGVGANLREHWLLMQFFRLRHWRDSDNRAFSGLRVLGNTLRMKLAGSGPMATSSSEVGAFLRTDPGLERPDVQLMFAPYSFTLGAAGVAFDRFPGMQAYGFVMRPDSVGALRIVSPDIHAPARIEPNYLSAERDRRASVAMVRQVRALMAQAALQPLVEGETATTAGARSDEEILDAFHRQGQAGYHASGTCRMGTDPEAVVDPQLRVRGVEGLRVMDCSIYPQIIAGNTNAPTMALAWRAADIIRSGA